MKKQRILITGATGFLGQRLINGLRHRDDKLYLPASSEMDLLNFNELEKKIAKFKPTIIYHLGALVNLSRDFKIGQQCVDVNTKGTFNLLESLHKHKPELFVFASTEEVYGLGPIPYSENQLPQPPSPYAVTKVAAEDLCRIYAQQLGFHTVIFRIGTMYGCDPSISRFIPQIIIKALKNENILLNSGIKERDYIYVDDVVDAFLLAKDKKLEFQNTIINLGGGVSYTLIEIVKKIINIANSKSKILTGKLPDRLMEANKWLLDNSKALKLLGWRPKTSIDKGLIKTVSYYKKIYDI